MEPGKIRLREEPGRATHRRGLEQSQVSRAGEPRGAGRSGRGVWVTCHVLERCPDRLATERRPRERRPRSRGAKHEMRSAGRSRDPREGLSVESWGAGLPRGHRRPHGLVSPMERGRDDRAEGQGQQCK